MLLKPVITRSLLAFPNHLCFLHYQAGLNIFNLLTQVSDFSCKYLHRLTPEIFFLPLPGLIPIHSSVLHLDDCAYRYYSHWAGPSASVLVSLGT